jgi:HK97 family phage major capsid protein
MPFNSILARNTDVPIPVEVSNELIESVVVSNPLLQMARRLPNLSRQIRSMPVMQALATAYFVNGDTGLKQTTQTSWANRNITAEELAVIVPIPQAVLDDSEYDIWGQVKPELQKAFNVAIVNAIIAGTNIPASWTVDLGSAGIVAGATAAGQNIQLAAYADAYEAILGMTGAGVLGLDMLVEQDGFAVTGNLAHLSMKGVLRNTRDVNGQPIFKPSMQTPTQYELDGVPLQFPSDGTLNPLTTLLIAGQFDQLVYAMRQDMTYKILDQAVIQDGAGNIIYNLAQQDMIALRAVVRLGVALPNPINRENTVAATRYPFANLRP